MARIPNPRAKAIREKNEQFHVRALRRHPYFDQIVKRIVEGKKATSIARWCKSSASKADGVKDYTFFTWRLYVTTLRRRIKVLLKDVDIREPTPELIESLVDQIRRDNYLPIQDKKSDSQPPTRSISTSLKIAIEEVEAEKILKFAFLAQCNRLEKLLTREEKTGVLEKNGYKEILVLVAIGAALGKLELGQYFMRAAKLYADSGTPPAKHVAKEQPADSKPTGSDPPLFFWDAD
jgi:hypothetical protein